MPLANTKPQNYLCTMSNPSPLTLQTFLQHIQNNALVLDTRVPDIFELGFVPGAVNIGLNGDFEHWIQELLQTDRKLVLVCASDKENESVERMVKTGFTHIEGWLQGGFDTWKQQNRYDMLISITPEELKLDKQFGEIEILDVRNQDEFSQGHVTDARNIPLPYIYEATEELSKEKTWYIHCQGGYRSVIAASILKSQGYKQVRNVWGGFNKIAEEQGMPLFIPKKK